jgi:hypothetical protein
VSGDDPALMAHVCSKFDLINVMDSLHPEDAHIPSYACSKNHLDYALVSKELFPDVTHSGLHHYHDFYPSDHRPIFLGLDPALFGHLPAIAPASTRGVNSNSTSVKAFIEAAHKHLMDTGTFAKLHRLQETLASFTPGQIQAQADSIDAHITRTLLSAERKCKKPQREPWSVILHEASLQVKYWRLTKAAHNNGYDATVTLAATNTLLPEDLQQSSDPLLTTNQQLNTAKRNLVHQRKHAKQLRKAFLHALRERIAARKTTSKLSAKESLRCISCQLKQSSHFGNIKHALRPCTQSSLSKVHVTTSLTSINPDTGETEKTNHVQVIDAKAELEAHILERNKRHFTQAKGTPFTQHPLKEMHAGNAQSYFDASGQPLGLPAGTFPETTSVLQLLREAMEDIPPSIPTTIAFDNFVTAFLHWNEHTSTSPSDRHLGLYKSLPTAHCDSGGEFDDVEKDSMIPSTKMLATAILEAIHNIATCVAERGLYLQRWIYVINVMIYKKAGVLELDELRVIHLFEADFNLLVGMIFGRRTVHNAVDHQRLHPSQYGKKGGECMDATVSKVLHNTIATYSKTLWDNSKVTPRRVSIEL